MNGGSDCAKRADTQVLRCENTGRELEPAHVRRVKGDARRASLLAANADVIITSPPYWNKRDYGVDGQLGQEPTASEFVAALVACLDDWSRLIPKWGSIFINLGDTYDRKSLAGVPARFEVAAQDAGWILRNRIIWAKDTGMPEPARNRLASRYEYIFHFVRSHDYYYDAFGYSEKFGNGATPGDVWKIGLRRDVSRHLAPFPEELVDRIVTLACPERVCMVCGAPQRRIVESTWELDAKRPQARRAMELARNHGLTEEHLAAIRATGISDAGKALKVQTGTGRNSARVKKLAAEAKAVLGGYFREFTYTKKRAAGWRDCGCNGSLRPGLVLDPFMGTGTTLRTANALGRSAVGIDLALLHDLSSLAICSDHDSSDASGAKHLPTEQLSVSRVVPATPDAVKYLRCNPRQFVR
jgi:DNA modification methylase